MPDGISKKERVEMTRLYIWGKTKLAELKQHLNQEEGQTLIEYALIIALIILVALLAFPALGNRIQQVFSAVFEKITVPNQVCEKGREHFRDIDQTQREEVDNVQFANCAEMRNAQRRLATGE
jgi:pilus assembly protein Flp/PilA